MATPIRYGVLFEVEVLHDFFLSLGSRVHEALDDAPRAAARRGYGVPDFLRVFPTAETAQALAGLKALFKSTDGGFLVGIRLDPTAVGNRPLVAPGADLRLRFALAAGDPRFYNYTLVEPADGFYSLGNGSGNEAAGARFLSLPVPAFQASRAYRAGEVRSQAAGAVVDLFRAERDTGPSATPVAADWRRIPPDTFDAAVSYTRGAVVLSANRLFRALIDGPGPDLTNAARWQPIGTLANQYVTAADSRALRAERFDLDLAAAASPRATVRLSRPGTGGAMVRELTFAAAAGNLGSVPVDFSGVAPGPYRLAVFNGAEADVPALGLDLYLDSEAVRGGWLGVVEMSLSTGGMALLDGAGALRSPRYTLRFLNRASRWRYRFPAAQVLGAGAEVAVEAGDPRVLVTADTRPLTRFGTGVRLRADLPATPPSEEVLLPEPEALSLRRQNQQWFSEIHTANLPL